jgi:hypothetical protein
MKYISIILFASIILSLNSCSKDHFLTGYEGTFKIGYGDCMPPIDTSNRFFDNYTGIVYFIRKSDITAGLSFEQLKENNVSEKIRNGAVSIELPADTFVVMPEDNYVFTSGNTIVIESGQVLKNDVQVWICTSY